MTLWLNLGWMPCQFSMPLFSPRQPRFYYLSDGSESLRGGPVDTRGGLANTWCVLWRLLSNRKRFLLAHQHVFITQVSGGSCVTQLVWCLMSETHEWPVWYSNSTPAQRYLKPYTWMQNAQANQSDKAYETRSHIIDSQGESFMSKIELELAGTLKFVNCGMLPVWLSP